MIVFNYDPLVHPQVWFAYAPPAGADHPRHRGPGPPQGPCQPEFFSRSNNVTAARKYLFVPRSRTVLMLNAAFNFSASPSLTPANAATGASRMSVSGKFSYALSNSESR